MLGLRKAIFVSLVALLGLLTVWTFVKSRRGNSQSSQPPAAEIVKQSKPTLTRVLRPPDLRIALSQWELLPPDAGSEQRTTRTFHARHALQIQNTGGVDYRNVMLELVYRDAGGKTLKKVARLANVAVGAGKTVPLPEFVLDAVPVRAAGCSVGILHADMEPGK